jgi:DNA-binding transcriptional regulator GbsR (MarR family)
VYSLFGMNLHQAEVPVESIFQNFEIPKYLYYYLHSLNIECRWMKSESLRIEFLKAIGETYSKYGYPDYCGWIEGLLLLEPREWSQQSIAKRLNELFPAAKYPTSISSINRALKILDGYGVVEKAGSRKTGYRYRLLSSSSLVASMLQQLISVNQEYIRMMENIAVRNTKGDSDLERSISYQISVAQVWNKAMEDLLGAIEEDIEG